MGDILDEVYNYFAPENEIDEDEGVIKVAIIGKPNAGKSSLVNKILNQERVIVSELPRNYERCNRYGVY